MYLFSRTGVLAGDQTAAMAWAVKIAGYVTETTGRPVTTWAGQFGSPLGTTVWSAFVDGLADFEAAFGGLGADAGYLALGNEGAAFNTTPHVALLRNVVVGGPNDDGPPPLGAIATVTTATCNAGRLGDAKGWSAELAGYLTGIGSPTSFLVDVHGPFGQVTWINVSATAAEADAMGALVEGDAGYLERLGGLSDLFVPGTGQRQQLVRIG
jgi:hypothetical protein